MDLLEFRLRNYAEVEPISGKPFSSKALRECYAQSAAHFGWQGRPLASRQMRDESGSLVDWGLGTATFPAIMFRGQARAVLRCDGTGLIKLGAQEMGRAAWTALAQIAADSLSSMSWSSGPAAPPARCGALPGAHRTPRPPEWRFMAPAQR
jgi:xanthine dehydrogenase YagR molybdenum-binding subunit